MEKRRLAGSGREWEGVFLIAANAIESMAAPHRGKAQVQNLVKKGRRIKAAGGWARPDWADEGPPARRFVAPPGVGGRDD